MRRRRGVVLVLVCVVVALMMTRECGMRSRPEPYVATATLSAAELMEGELHSAMKGGQIKIGAVSIVIGVSTGSPEPLAVIGVGTANDFSLGGSYSLRLGESVTVPGIGVVTLVSFDDWGGAQAVTLLVALEAGADEPGSSATPSSVPTPTSTP